MLNKCCVKKNKYVLLWQMESMLCLSNGKPHILAGSKPVHMVGGGCCTFLMWKLVAFFPPSPFHFCFKMFVSAVLRGGVKTKDLLVVSALRFPASFLFNALVVVTDKAYGGDKCGGKQKRSFWKYSFSIHCNSGNHLHYPHSS